MYPVVRKTFHNIFCPFLRVCVGIELFDNKYIIRYCLYYEMYVSRENVEKKKNNDRLDTQKVCRENTNRGGGGGTEKIGPTNGRA